MKVTKVTKVTLKKCTIEDVANYIFCNYGLKITGMEYCKSSPTVIYQLSSDLYSLHKIISTYVLIIK